MCVFGRPHSTAYAWRAACQEREPRATGSGCEGTVRAAERGLPRIAACDRRAGPCQRAAHQGVPTQLRRLFLTLHSDPNSAFWSRSDCQIFKVFPKAATSEIPVCASRREAMQLRKIPSLRFPQGDHAYWNVFRSCCNLRKRVRSGPECRIRVESLQLSGASL